jgi:hypothetical protein
MQGSYGGSAYGSTPQNDYVILTPFKVPLPTLTTWVEELYKAPCLWVKSASFGIFVGVTPRACPGEIVQRCLAASLTRGNVLAAEGCVGEKGRAAAIFA